MYRKGGRKGGGQGWGSQRGEGRGRARGRGRCGYDWRKHLPEGHPAKSEEGCSRDEMESYRASRVARRREEDEAVLEQMARRREEAPMVGQQWSEEERALVERQAEERKLRALARDSHPAEVWIRRAEGEALERAVDAALQEWGEEATDEPMNVDEDSLFAPMGEASSPPIPSAEEEERLRVWGERASVSGERLGRHTLPAWASCQEVVKAVRTHQVVVISGETGCGKSTQAALPPLPPCCHTAHSSSSA